jgi:hypothetical protein
MDNNQEWLDRKLGIKAVGEVDGATVSRETEPEMLFETLPPESLGQRPYLSAKVATIAYDLKVGTAGVEVSGEGGYLPADIERKLAADANERLNRRIKEGSLFATLIGEPRPDPVAEGWAALRHGRVPVPLDPLHGRYGRFSIAGKIIRQRPSDMFAVMAHMVVVRAEWRFELDCVEFCALSALFTPVPEGGVAPLYRIILTAIEGGPPKVTAWMGSEGGPSRLGEETVWCHKLPNGTTVELVMRADRPGYFAPSQDTDGAVFFYPLDGSEPSCLTIASASTKGKS